MRRRRATVATSGEWQCKIRAGGVRRLAVANGPNIFQMLLGELFHEVDCSHLATATVVEMSTDAGD